MSVHVGSSHCGNKFGNTQRREGHESTSRRPAITFNGARDDCNVETRAKEPSTLRYLLCVHPKSLGFSGPYPALFPQCFHTGRNHPDAESRKITAWKLIPRSQLAKAAEAKAAARSPGNKNAVKHGLHSYKALLIMRAGLLIGG